MARWGSFFELGPLQRYIAIIPMPSKFHSPLTLPTPSPSRFPNTFQHKCKIHIYTIVGTYWLLYKPADHHKKLHVTKPADHHKSSKIRKKMRPLTHFSPFCSFRFWLTFLIKHLLDFLCFLWSSGGPWLWPWPRSFSHLGPEPPRPWLIFYCRMCCCLIQQLVFTDFVQVATICSV